MGQGCSKPQWSIENAWSNLDGAATSLMGRQVSKQILTAK